MKGRAATKDIPASIEYTRELIDVFDIVHKDRLCGFPVPSTITASAH